MITSFPAGVSSFGVPVAGSLPTTFGKIIFCNYDTGSDGNNGEDMESPVKTLAQAYSLARTNKDDIIALSSYSAHPVTEMLTVAKNRVHFVGLGGFGRVSGQRTRITMGVTGVATDLAPIMVTGVGNTFHGLKVDNGSTTNASLYGFIDNGECTYIENCHFLKTAGLDDAGWASFWLAGDSLNMFNCTFGQSNLPSAVAHYGILIDGKTGGATDGTVKECFLKNIYINMSVSTAAASTACFVKVADNAALNFNNTIENLVGFNFVQNGTGTIMTDAVLAAASTVGGYLNLVNPSFMGCTGVGGGSGYGVYISSAPAADANGGLGTTLTD